MQQSEAIATNHGPQQLQQPAAAPQNKRYKDHQQAADTPAHGPCMGHDYLLALLLRQTDITWHQAAVCRLLCVSKGVQEQVCQLLRGRVYADMHLKYKYTLAAAWLSKHATLLDGLHLDFPRVDEERPGWGSACGWGCGCCSDEDGNMEVLNKEAEALLAAALATEEPAEPTMQDAAPLDPQSAPALEPAAAAVQDNAADKEAGGNSSCDGNGDVSDEDDIDGDSDEMFLSSDEMECEDAHCFGRPRAVHLRTFSTTTPAPRVLAVLPVSSLTRLELTFHQDDVLLDDGFIKQVSKPLRNLAGLQSLILNMASFPEKNVHITVAFDAVMRAVRELRQLKHLEIGQLSRLWRLQQLPAQLTSLTIIIIATGHAIAMWPSTPLLQPANSVTDL